MKKNQNCIWTMWNKLFILFFAFWDTSVSVVILRDHKYPQKLTIQILIDVTVHVGLIPQLVCCQLGFTTRRTTPLAITKVATEFQNIARFWVTFSDD